MTERGVLMNWVPQRERLVRMWKECNQVSHSQTRDCRWRDLSDIERKQPSQCSTDSVSTLSSKGRIGGEIEPASHLEARTCNGARWGWQIDGR